jgi:shikimate kinase
MSEASAVLPLVFIGPMAAGKSRIGRRVAAGLGVRFIDTDSLVVAEHGPISEIFAREGEDFFRVLERAAVEDALTEPAVVSLGGGAVLDPLTRADLAETSVILLTIGADAAAKRIRGAKRPLLADGGIETWTRIYEERRPIYEELADVTFDTSERPISAIVDDILNWAKGRA